MLGGHGDNIEVFTTTTWQDWGYPILEEYGALVALGFSRISIAATSAGVPLVLEPFASEKLKELPPPRHLFFVDPFIIPQDKNLNLIPLVGFIVGNVLEYDENTTEAELFNWYRNRPYQTLIQLNKLIKRVRKLLKKNIVLDPATKVKIYQSKEDGTSDPKGATLLANGLRHPVNQSFVELEYVESSNHVFIQGLARNSENWTSLDVKLQKRVFSEMKQRVLKQ